MLMHVLQSDSVAEDPCKLFFRLLLTTFSLEPQLLHGFCHKVMRIESAARAMLLKCTAGC